MLFRSKKWIFDHSKIHLVAASQWTYRIIQDSPILSDLPCTVIPFGLNTRIFYPHDKQTSRQKLGIPANNHVIMFRCMAGTPYKGLRYIKEALAELDNTRHNITLLTVGSTGLIPELTSKYQIIEMGTVYEPEKMADVLSAADIFLMPSIAESFGMMAVEAMACGVIPLVFEGTALPDITHAPHCGIAVPSKDSKALLEAIYHLLNDPADYSKRSAYALELVKSEYNTEAYIRRHMNLYYSLSSQCWQPAEFECAISLLNLVCNQDQQPLKQNPHIDPIWWRALRKIKRLLFPQKVK